MRRRCRKSSPSLPAAQWTATFRRDLKDSDALHWGEAPCPSAPKISAWWASWPRGRTTSSTVARVCGDRGRLQAPQTQMLRVGDEDVQQLHRPAAAGGPAKFNTVIVWWRNLQRVHHRRSTNNQGQGRPRVLLADLAVQPAARQPAYALVVDEDLRHLPHRWSALIKRQALGLVVDLDFLKGSERDCSSFLAESHWGRRFWSKR